MSLREFINESSPNQNDLLFFDENNLIYKVRWGNKITDVTSIGLKHANDETIFTIHAAQDMKNNIDLTLPHTLNNGLLGNASGQLSFITNLNAGQYSFHQSTNENNTLQFNLNNLAAARNVHFPDSDVFLPNFSESNSSVISNISNDNWNRLLNLNQSLTTSSNVSFSTIGGRINTPNQPNITSIGTLSSNLNMGFQNILNLCVLQFKNGTTTINCSAPEQGQSYDFVFPLNNNDGFMRNVNGMKQWQQHIDANTDIDNLGTLALLNTVNNTHIDDGTITVEKFAPEIRSQLHLALRNLESDRDPVATDNSTVGYSVGSKWYNQDSKEAWEMIGESEQKAVWVKTTLTGDELGSMAYQDKLNVNIEGGNVSNVVLNQHK